LLINGAGVSIVARSFRQQAANIIPGAVSQEEYLARVGNCEVATVARDQEVGRRSGQRSCCADGDGD
jgi:hypothetical protein